MIPENIQEAIKKDRENSLFIARVPPKTKAAFLDLANAEFCSDYGFCLKYLMDYFLEESARYTQVISMIQELSSRMDSLEKKPEVKEIRTVGGVLIGKK